MGGSASAVVVCAGLGKEYSDGGQIVHAVRDVSLESYPGKVTAIVGPSGSGKTTLLHLIGGVEHPDSGTIFVDGVDLAGLSTSELTDFRARFVSFVFADLNLLPVLSIYENVNLGLILLRLPAPEAHARAMEALDRVGLSDRAHRLPGALSSGERQRVAVARALARRSPLVIADEPTAHLDHELASEIGLMLKDLASGCGSTVVMATHDNAIAEQSDQVVRLRDGRRAD